MEESLACGDKFKMPNQKDACCLNDSGKGKTTRAEKILVVSRGYKIGERFDYKRQHKRVMCDFGGDYSTLCTPERVHFIDKNFKTTFK